jgi:hypothetical protein
MARYIRRRRRKRKTLKPAVLCLCAGLLMLFGVFERGSESPRAARIIRTVPESYTFEDYTVPVSIESLSTKVVYPYSVIRGGVRDRTDLVREISKDPVVAAHYSDFDASQAEIVRVRDEKLVHVSYRVDNKIFWTANKIRLGQGEALISDGSKMARARCGNRISAAPQEPVSEAEPPPEVFNTPNIPINEDILADETISLEPLQLFEEFDTPLLTMINPPDVLTLEDRFFTEEFLPYNPTFNFTPTYFFPHEEPSPTPFDVPGVPEPSTFILLASGMVAHFVFRRFISKR